MKFDARKEKVYIVPPINPGEPGGMAVLDVEGYLIAYKRRRDSDLRNWDYVRADMKNST